VREPALNLSEEQRARVNIAHSTLNRARTLNLAALSPAELVSTVESLRASLHDTLHVVSELTE